ncbi:MAG: T9SS type A sorting domain-containing protein [Bacteroidales bacterium]|nr:T9SS type A sorting domain-containing protein [Bacteroidales bacterium]
MKKIFSLVLSILLTLNVFSQTINKTQVSLGQDSIKYIHDVIPTALIDSLGIHPDSILFITGGSEPFLNTSFSVSNIAHYWSEYPIALQHRTIKQIFTTERVLSRGYAQTMYSDTSLQIGGVMLLLDFLRFNNANKVVSNVGDTLQIIDANSSDWSVVYEKVLNDTIFYDENYPVNGIYNIILDSAVTVQGDYLIAFKFHPTNIIQVDQRIDGTMDFHYNMPLSVYITASSIDGIDSTSDEFWHYFHTDWYDKLRNFTNKNYQRQIYCYNYEYGWNKFKDYAELYGLTECEIYSPIGFEIVGTIYTDLTSSRGNVPHTTDLALFVIPEYAVDSIDRLRVRGESFNEDISNKSRVSVLPNPAKDVVRIACGTTINSVEIFNLQGIKVENKAINARETNINIASYKQGVYLIKINTNQGYTTKQIIKQ